MIGVFIALDLFLFYVFWDAMLIPMYFLIGVWGYDRRIYAALTNNTARGTTGGLKDGGRMAMDHRHNGARVGAEVFDRVEGQLWVDHHHDRANFECAKERRHERRPVGERDDHAMLGLHAGALEQRPKPVGERLHLAIGVRGVIGQQRRTVALAFSDARIQQPISDV